MPCFSVMFGRVVAAFMLCLMALFVPVLIQSGQAFFFIVIVCVWFIPVFFVQWIVAGALFAVTYRWTTGPILAHAGGSVGGSTMLILFAWWFSGGTFPEVLAKMCQGRSGAVPILLYTLSNCVVGMWFGKSVKEGQWGL